jgi:hypothetical protein
MDELFEKEYNLNTLTVFGEHKTNVDVKIDRSYISPLHIVIDGIHELLNKITETSTYPQIIVGYEYVYQLLANTIRANESKEFAEKYKMTDELANKYFKTTLIDVFMDYQEKKTNGLKSNKYLQSVLFEFQKTKQIYSTDYYNYLIKYIKSTRFGMCMIVEMERIDLKKKYEVKMDMYINGDAEYVLEDDDNPYIQYYNGSEMMVVSNTLSRVRLYCETVSGLFVGMMNDYVRKKNNQFPLNGVIDIILEMLNYENMEEYKKYGIIDEIDFSNEDNYCNVCKSDFQDMECSDDEKRKILSKYRLKFTCDGQNRNHITCLSCMFKHISANEPICPLCRGKIGLNIIEHNIECEMKHIPLCYATYFDGNKLSEIKHYSFIVMLSVLNRLKAVQKYNTVPRALEYLVNKKEMETNPKISKSVDLRDELLCLEDNDEEDESTADEHLVASLLNGMLNTWAGEDVVEDSEEDSEED